jgi:hypothetical protein
VGVGPCVDGTAWFSERSASRLRPGSWAFRSRSGFTARVAVCRPCGAVRRARVRAGRPDGAGGRRTGRPPAPRTRTPRSAFSSSHSPRTRAPAAHAGHGRSGRSSELAGRSLTRLSHYSATDTQHAHRSPRQSAPRTHTRRTSRRRVGIVPGTAALTRYRAGVCRLGTQSHSGLALAPTSGGGGVPGCRVRGVGCALDARGRGREEGLGTRTLARRPRVAASLRSVRAAAAAAVRKISDK